MIYPIPPAEGQAEIDKSLAARLHASANAMRAVRTAQMLAALPRLMLGTFILLNCVTMLTDPATLVAKVINGSGAWGRPVVWLLLVMAAVSLLDFFITDILPPRFTIRCVRERRHVLYHAMAIVLIALSIVFAMYAPRSPLVWLFYAKYAFFSAAIAWLDLFSRPRT